MNDHQKTQVFRDAAAATLKKDRVEAIRKQIDDARLRHEARKAARDEIVKLAEEIEGRSNDAGHRVKVLDYVGELLKVVAEKREAKFRKGLEALVTQALRAVFDDDSYTFFIEQDSIENGVKIIPDIVNSFPSGSDRPSAELAKECRRLARKLRVHPDRVFTIVGHADTETDLVSNVGDFDILALSRARRIARVMGLQRLPLERVTIVSHADRKPRNAGRTVACGNHPGTMTPR
ncbi:MAG: hypothetical protein IIC28_11975 [Chloroflexi bacterium]|nr:hypothetical protein [Chloroflexota bacterium]